MPIFSGFGFRNALRKYGLPGANTINRFVPTGETPFATPEELDELNKLRALPRRPTGDQTFGQVYNSGGLGETMNGNKFKNPILRRISELSKLQGARPTRSGGRKATRRRRHRVRQTRRK